MIITEAERKKKGKHYPELGSYRGGLLTHTLMNGLGNSGNRRFIKGLQPNHRSEMGHGSA
jgi:hypothetical protein